MGIVYKCEIDDRCFSLNKPMASFIVQIRCHVLLFHVFISYLSGLTFCPDSYSLPSTLLYPIIMELSHACNLSICHAVYREQRNRGTEWIARYPYLHCIHSHRCQVIGVLFIPRQSQQRMMLWVLVDDCGVLEVTQVKHTHRTVGSYAHKTTQLTVV